jgi:Fe2+ or Zn2+ uptake regulation protein
VEYFSREIPNLFLVTFHSNIDMEVFIHPLPHFFVVPAMEKLDLQTRITLVRLFYENHSCAAAALRKFKSLHNLIKDPFSVTTVQRLLKKFESEGVVIDLPKSGRPSISDEVVETGFFLGFQQWGGVTEFGGSLDRNKSCRNQFSQNSCYITLVISY